MKSKKSKRGGARLGAGRPPKPQAGAPEQVLSAPISILDRDVATLTDDERREYDAAAIAEGWRPSTAVLLACFQHDHSKNERLTWEEWRSNLRNPSVVPTVQPEPLRWSVQSQCYEPISAPSISDVVQPTPFVESPPTEIASCKSFPCNTEKQENDDFSTQPSPQPVPSPSPSRLDRAIAIEASRPRPSAVEQAIFQADQPSTRSRSYTYSEVEGMRPTSGNRSHDTYEPATD